MCAKGRKVIRGPKRGRSWIDRNPRVPSSWKIDNGRNDERTRSRGLWYYNFKFDGMTCFSHNVHHQ